MVISHIHGTTIVHMPIALAMPPPVRRLNRRPLDFVRFKSALKIKNRKHVQLFIIFFNDFPD